ncbi:MAG: FtsW/RodA/SpoVE family cell cycle protein [Thermoanaerobaculales bacterium]|nr:FtsW/RodA/SpoVE family cell cycle protein [Thermoanaerobaculales bacterium]
MPITQHFDRLLFAATISLTAIGLAVMGSASWVLSTERYHRPASYFLTWQAATAVAGFILMLVVMHLRTEVLLRPKVVSAVLGLSWIILVGAYLQPRINGTHRWLNLGGISVQPSVVARLALVLFVAVFLARARSNGWNLKNLAIVGAGAALTGGLILGEPDLGSAALVIAVVGTMTFVAGIPVRLLAIPLIAAVVIVALAISQSPYRLARVKSFIGAGTSAASYQSEQSLVAIGSGGLLGRGYGAGLQKFFFLPEPHTDFVLASTAEELGLVGLLVLLSLVSVITWRGIRLSGRQTDSARSLLGFGLTFTFAAQSLLHILVCLRLAPPKGIPFPLVSYGKTDLFVTLMAMGLLLNLSRGVRS